jgi:hypothetical protein
MNEPPRYPKDDEIKIEWTVVHKAIIAISILVIWPLFIYTVDLNDNFIKKCLSTAGLNIDIIGVVVASLKTPYYGLFCDGGKIEFNRAKIEKKYFQSGMWLIALGSLFQAIGTLI